jgi:glycerophosphoryl diester phosphodiesterase
MTARARAWHDGAMSVSSIAATKEIYAVSGTVYPVPFPFVNASEVRVLLHDSATGALTPVASGYTITGGNGSTGTLTFEVEPTEGDELVILRNTPLSQLLDVNYNEGLTLTLLEDALDKLTRIAQDMADSPVIRFPESEPASANQTLSPAGARAGKILGFNALTGGMEEIEPEAFTATATATAEAAALSAQGSASTAAGHAGTATSAAGTASAAAGAASSSADAAAASAEAAAASAAEADGNSADITAEAITDALGYVPADADNLPAVDNAAVNAAIATAPNDTREALGLGEPISLSNIIFPAYIAHRGAPALIPDNTIAGFRVAAKYGMPIMEPDVYALGDGTPVVYHDSSQVESIPYSINSVNLPYWRKLKYLNTNNLPGWGSEAMPTITFEDLVREFGNKVILFPEIKDDSSTTAMLRLIKQYGIRKDMFMIQGASTRKDAMLQFIAAGYPACINDVTADFAARLAEGFGWTIYNWAETTKIANAKSAGFMVAVATPNRHHERDAAIAAGADMILTDEPVYVAGNGTWKRATDPYGLLVPHHGSQRSRSTITITSNGELSFPSQSTGTHDNILLGWASPLDTPSGSSLAFSVYFDDVLTNDSFASIFVNTSDVAVTTETATADKTGYRFVIRRSGVLEIQKYDGVGGITSETFSGTLIALDSWVPLKIEIAPSTVKLIRTDNGESVTMTDAVHRGAYLSAGAKSTNLLMKNFTVLSPDPAVIDDASLILARLAANGIALTSTQETAINTFVDTEYAAGRWQKVKYFNLPIWGAGNEVPNALDWKSLAYGIYTGGITHANGYIQGDGSTARFNTGKSLTNLGATSGNAHMGCLITQFGTQTGTIMGLFGGGTYHTSIQHNTTPVVITRFSNTNDYVDSGTVSPGIFTLSASSNTSRSLRRRGSAGATSLATSAGETAFALQNKNIYVLTGNNNNGTDNSWFNGRLGAAFMGLGLSDSEADGFTGSLKTLWETLTGLSLP